ncbi:hypothetical protein J3E07_001636 [Methanococcus voltae]|uniref:Uncharacterized protein n=1 Tax=Methanococcus voltae TaxID=2188 RepID=A0A8J7RIQ9_METVO|nr:hypothetical protein [Methanococcus voltae]MBP2202195.1 hypothetical protein [Methanococcus voltae]
MKITKFYEMIHNGQTVSTHKLELDTNTESVPNSINGLNTEFERRKEGFEYCYLDLCYQDVQLKEITEKQYDKLNEQLDILTIKKSCNELLKLQNSNKHLRLYARLNDSGAVVEVYNIDEELVDSFDFEMRTQKGQNRLIAVLYNDLKCKSFWYYEEYHRDPTPQEDAQFTVDSYFYHPKGA